MPRSALMQKLREERTAIDRERPVEEAMAAALWLGEQAVRDYASARGCTRAQARRDLRAERRRGRRASACMDF